MALLDGCEYGLVSKDHLTSANLSCVHVKLTDAALKAIEDRLKINRSSRPTIEISDDGGVIRIPDGTGSRDFVFAVGPLPSDPNGSFDCIKQAKNGKLDTLDTMTQKIIVKASDDVYQTTKDRLAERTEESRKNCAKEINQTRQGIKSKKITKTIKRTGNGIAPSVLPPVASKPDWIAPSISAPSTSPPRIMANPSTASNSTTTAVKKLEKLKRRQLSKLTASANAAAAARSKTNGLSKSEKEKSKAALLSVPLRERIIQTLALKPHMFKTPDLLLKLKTEGLASQGDNQAEISRILDSVAIPNSKGCWSLKPSSMSMVDVNWQFYSEPDKQLVKRNLNRPAAAAPPTASSPNLQPAVPTSKRKADNEEKAEHKSKKHKSEQNDAQDLHDPGISEDFLRDYVAISHQDQRNRYKDEFNKEYEEYIHLFKYIDGVTKKWVDLARRLDLAGQGTPDHTKLEKKIKKEYKKTKNCLEYQQSKQRLEYLHGKLTHIKALVSDYDTAQLGS